MTRLTLQMSLAKKTPATFQFLFAGVVIILYSTLVCFSRSSYSQHLPIFLSLYTLINLALVGFAFVVIKRGVQFSVRYVFAVSLIVHLIAFMGKPLFEDDYYRYLWDAWHWFEYGTPYGTTPEAYFLDQTIPARFQELLSHLNNPELPTIYGPVLQFSFAAAYLIAPGEIWPLQLLFGFSNLGLIWVLLKIAKPNFVLLYAVNPLVFKEILLTIHPDIIGILFLFLAILARQKSCFLFLGGFLAFSIGSKIFSILLVPFLLLRAPVKSYIALGITLLIIYLPFMDLPFTGLPFLENFQKTSLSVMVTNWEFNSFIWAITTHFLVDNSARLLLAGMLGSFYAWCGWRSYKQSTKQPEKQLVPIPRGDLLIGAFLLCAPVINPWYWVWVLPFAVLTPSVSTFAASYLLILSYIIPIHINGLGLDTAYDQPVWIKMIEFSLLSIIIFVELLLYYLRSKNKLVQKKHLH